jgi:putative tryptophan/tyrosine transport system substrate-binding protein
VKRREVIAGLGSAPAWPVAALAQQRERVWLIGALMVGDENDPVAKVQRTVFTQALADLGLDRWPQRAGGTSVGGGDINRIRAFAQELVGLQPDIVVTNGVAATIALQRNARTVPIVFVSVGDPVASGVVARLDRPGGNITGFANNEATLGGKWLELLLEIAPGLKRAAIMFNPDAVLASTYVPSFETAARSLKVEPIIAPVHSDAEIDTAIMALRRELGGGLVIVPNAFTTTHRATINSTQRTDGLLAI